MSKYSEALDMPDMFGDVTKRPQPKLARWYHYNFKTIREALLIADALERMRQQEDIPPEFQKVLEENFWELLA